MNGEDFRNEVTKIMAVKGELVRFDWMKLTNGEWRIGILTKPTARQLKRLKPIISDFYGQELT